MTKNLKPIEKSKLISHKTERRRSPSPQKRREEPHRRKKPTYDEKFEYSYNFSETVEESGDDDLLRKRIPSYEHNDAELVNKKVN